MHLKCTNAAPAWASALGFRYIGTLHVYSLRKSSERYVYYARVVKRATSHQTF